ncbi:MAG: FAD-binding oxidoreductase [Nannocystaceae bacterium]
MSIEPEPRAPLTPLSGWGKVPTVDGRVIAGDDLERLSRDAVLSRGLGRAYADAALPPPGSDRPILLTPFADRILDFDPETGVLRAEAGLSLGALREVFVPRGFFTPVSPGTRHVTLGGAVAADIHGKNHHVAGCFGEHVVSLLLRTGDGRILEVSEEHEPELLRATLGGMGLTGHILEVSVRLERIPSGWIYQETERLPDLDAVIESLAQASATWPMTVAWVDTSARGASMGRGIVMRGRWAEPSEAPAAPPKVGRGIPMPIQFPSGLANPATFGLLNWAWFQKHPRRVQRGVVSLESWFWILDAVGHWNRVYGRRGFTQYQCVLPKEARAYPKLLERFQAGGGASFVTVFKDCGPEGKGMLSFPRAGTSLALDIPYAGESTRALCRDLNRHVLDHGGRVYLAKDAFTTADELRAMYPRLDEWTAVRRRFDPELRIRSAQSVRVFGDPA